MFTCRNQRDETHQHEFAEQARICWLLQRQQDDREAVEERWAEGAWLRAAEAGTPETWAEEDRDRLMGALGYGPPC